MNGKGKQGYRERGGEETVTLVNQRRPGGGVQVRGRGMGDDGKTCFKKRGVDVN